MRVTEILERLPANTEWMVLFDIEALRPLASEALMREMFFLGKDVPLADKSHVILSSHGRLLAPREASSAFVDGESGAERSLDATHPSLGSAFDARTRLFPVDSAHVFAVGAMPPYEPVVLHIEIKNGEAQAKALFSGEPSKQHYDLLRAVGVRYVASEPRKEGHVAHFRNQLPTHLHAGILNHFARTSNCNLFFLQHGNIDAPLREGLVTAAHSRIRERANKLTDTVERLAQDALQRPLPMRWEPPAPRQPLDFGDVVPLAFLHHALRVVRPSAPVLSALSERLEAVKLRGLWPFQSNDLETSVDSALVLLGHHDAQALAGVDRFLDASGGYLPQLVAERAEAGKMMFEPEKRHWCQPDYATTALLHAARLRGGLAPNPATQRYLRERFERRAGLYFANPYLVDWCVAQALAQDEQLADLRPELARDLLASQNPDGSFGRYDLVLSTSLAILALQELGTRSERALTAQLALLELMPRSVEVREACPFYSSLILPAGTALGPQVELVSGSSVAISRHVDQHGHIASALATLALTRPVAPSDDAPSQTSPASPRYEQESPVLYAARAALPNYL